MPKTSSVWHHAFVCPEAKAVTMEQPLVCVLCHFPPLFPTILRLVGFLALDRSTNIRGLSWYTTIRGLVGVILSSFPPYFYNKLFLIDLSLSSAHHKVSILQKRMHQWCYTGTPGWEGPVFPVTRRHKKLTHSFSFQHGVALIRTHRLTGLPLRTWERGLRVYLVCWRFPWAFSEVKLATQHLGCSEQQR